MVAIHDVENEKDTKRADDFCNERFQNDVIGFCGSFWLILICFFFFSVTRSILESMCGSSGFENPRKGIDLIV